MLSRSFALLSEAKVTTVRTFHLVRRIDSSCARHHGMDIGLRILSGTTAATHIDPFCDSHYARDHVG